MGWVPNHRRLGTWHGTSNGTLQHLNLHFASFLTNPQPIVATQNALPASQNNLGMSLIIFAQYFGGSLFLAFAELVFSHGLSQYLASDAPNVNAALVIEAGATGFRSVVSAEDLPGVINAYAKADNWAFYLGTGISGMAFLVSFGMGWRNPNKNEKRKEKKGESNGSGDEEKTRAGETSRNVDEEKVRVEGL